MVPHPDTLTNTHTHTDTSRVINFTKEIIQAHNNKTEKRMEDIHVLAEFHIVPYIPPSPLFIQMSTEVAALQIASSPPILPYALGKRYVFLKEKDSFLRLIIELSGG